MLGENAADRSESPLSGPDPSGGMSARPQSPP